MQPTYEVLPSGSPPPPKKGILQTIGGWFVAAVVAVIKFKFVIFAALKTSLSMLFMIWIYSLAFGWAYAAGIVLLIFVHEMGHVIAAKWVGLPVSAPVFIPFVGAYILMNENPRDAYTEAIVGYGGPLAGFLGSWVCLVVGLHLQEHWIIAVASTSFLINLFNMIPVPPLDGGRICAAVSPWFWFIGLALLGAALFYFHNWLTSLIIVGIVFFAAMARIKQTFFEPPTPEMQQYYNTHISNRLTMAILYVGLIGVLLIGYIDASQHLTYLWQN